jgi:hypothetical protein
MLMTLVGHSTAQMPQPLQWARSTPVTFPSFTLIVPSGQKTQQIIQLVHRSRSMTGFSVLQLPVSYSVALPEVRITAPMGRSRQFFFASIVLLILLSLIQLLVGPFGGCKIAVDHFLIELCTE